MSDQFLNLEHLRFSDDMNSSCYEKSYLNRLQMIRGVQKMLTCPHLHIIYLDVGVL